MNCDFNSNEHDLDDQIESKYDAETPFSKKRLHDNDDISVVSDLTTIEDNRVKSTYTVPNYNVLEILYNNLFSVGDVTQTPRAATLTSNHKLKLKEKRCRSKNKKISSKVYPYHSIEPTYSNVKNKSYENIVNSLYTIASFIDKQNPFGVEVTITDIFTEECVLQTPALSKPRVGRQHFIEMLKSVMRSSSNLSFRLSGHEKSEIGGCTVVTFQHFLQFDLVRKDSSDYLWNDISNLPEKRSYFEFYQSRALKFFRNAVLVGNYVMGVTTRVNVEGLVSVTLNKNNYAQSLKVSRKSIKMKFLRPNNDIVQTKKIESGRESYEQSEEKSAKTEDCLSR